MVIDSSAIVAIFRKEDGYELLAYKLGSTHTCYMSAATHLETSIVLIRKLGEDAANRFDDFVIDFGIEIVPVSLSQSRLARQAFLRYGKGRHPAKLNFGDCLCYALAKQLGEPLLYKGNDFAQTDLAGA